LRLPADEGRGGEKKALGLPLLGPWPEWPVKKGGVVPRTPGRGVSSLQPGERRAFCFVMVIRKKRKKKGSSDASKRKGK